LLVNLPSTAQLIYKLKVVNTDSQAIFKKVSYKKQVTSREFILQETNKIYVSLVNEGYISASVDSIKQDSLNYTAYINAGEKYKWVNLRYAKKDQGIISKLGYNERFFSNRPFKFTELSRFMEKLIVYYENNGYPFVLAKLDSLEFDKSQVKALVKIEKNVFVKLDSLVTEGTGKVSQKFLLRYLGIKNGMPYSAEVFSNVSKKIRQLPFVTEKRLQLCSLPINKINYFCF